MQLTKSQKNVVFSKPSKYSAIRGGEYTGKTTTAIHRVLFLMNNYCLYNEDKLLMVVKNEFELNKARALYQDILDESGHYYDTLFKHNEYNFEIYTMELLLKKYLHNNYSIASDKEKYGIISSCINSLRSCNPSLKILKQEYIQFFLEEVNWIKACNLTKLEEYQSIQRTGRKYPKGEGPNRLLKASQERSIIHSMYNMYYNKLKTNGLTDNEAIVDISIEKANEEYAHIVIDDAQNLTKRQIDFLDILNFNKTYSSNLYIINKDKCENKNAWFVKSRKLGFKSSYMNSPFLAVPKKNFGLENFQYHDLKHRAIHEFVRDPFDLSEVIVPQAAGEQVFKEDELKTVPVFNEIAAGEPIYINDEQENNFYIPKYWLKGTKDCFILKVKGDSMIGANFNDGDLVVINQSYSAENNDIVAVNIDGSATLKRLSINKSGVVLMPENDKYNPIYITEEGASIIGVAVGIIKAQV